MNDNKVKGTKSLTSANTLSNAVSFLIDQSIRQQVNTAEVVSINAADQSGTDGPAGYASATPLVCQTDAYNNALPPNTLYKLPYLRPQAGKAAIIMDPQPGDKAIAISMKRDSTRVSTGKNDPVQPGSFRYFDQADSYLINGFLGEKPEYYLNIDPVTGNIILSTKAANIEISCRESGDIDLKTISGNVSIQAGNAGQGTITLDGQVLVTRTIQVQNKNNEAASNFTGGFNNTGGTVTSNGVTLETHTHSGVQTGSGSTGGPT